MVSFPHVAWCGRCFKQPLQRLLPWAVMVLEVGLSMVVIEERVSDPRQLLPHNLTSLESKQKGCSVLPCHPHTWHWGEQRCLRAHQQHQASTRAGGCAGSPPRTSFFLVGSHKGTHHQPQDVMAQRGRGTWRGDMARGGLGVVPPPARKVPASLGACEKSWEKG